MTEEQYLLQCLAQLRQAYERDAKPYLDRLVAIRSLQTSAPLVLSIDQAREFIDFKMGAASDEEVWAGDDMMGSSG